MRRFRWCTFDFRMIFQMLLGIRSRVIIIQQSTPPSVVRYSSLVVVPPRFHLCTVSSTLERHSRLSFKSCVTLMQQRSSVVLVHTCASFTFHAQDAWRCQ